MRLTKATLTATTLLLLALSPIPFAGSAAAAATCYGGDPDTSAIPLAEGYHLSARDGTVWRDTNDLPGIQRAETFCYENVDGTWRSWTVKSDLKVAGAPDPGDLPVRCQIRPLICSIPV